MAKVTSSSKHKIVFVLVLFLSQKEVNQILGLSFHICSPLSIQWLHHQNQNIIPDNLHKSSLVLKDI